MIKEHKAITKEEDKYERLQQADTKRRPNDYR